MYSDEPGILTIRTQFDEFTGLYVMHCHRLNHEDNGLMALINVIPTVSVYAVAIPGEPGKPAEVRLYDGDGDRFIATIIAFPGYEGGVNACDPRTMRTQIDEAIGRVFDPGDGNFL